jgi:hypothetical protein
MQNKYMSTPSKLILLPAPRQLHRHPGTNPGTRERLRKADVGRSEADAYRLTITPAEVLIEAPGERGVFYARQTLTQIRHQFPGELPCLEILDWPDFPVRGFYHDVARGKVPTLKTLLALAEKCAHYKLNHLQLYIEHTFAFKNFPRVWRGSDPLTAADIRKLDAHCARLQIDLVPSFSTFGHLYGFIHTPEFQHLNEMERDISGDPFTWWDRQRGCTLDCRNPESLALIREIISEVRPLFRSKLFNICCDETMDLGKGKNRALAARLGEGRLYVDFLSQIMQVVRDHGATPMFWGDIVGRHHSGMIRKIPADAIALDWDYSAGLTFSKAPLMQKARLKFYICPGVGGWGRWLNDYRSAYLNITRYAKSGKACGAAGLLNTDWGDFGHINALGLSFPGLITGAAAAWNARSPALGRKHLEAAISRYEFGDPSGRLLTLMREASSAARAPWETLVFWQQPRSKNMGDEWFDADTGLPKQFFKFSAARHTAALGKILSLTRSIEKILSGAKPLDSMVADEIRTALLAMRVQEEIFLIVQSRYRRLRIPLPGTKATVGRIRSLVSRADSEWHKRSKPSEFAFVRDVLLGAAAALTAGQRERLPREAAACNTRACEADETGPSTYCP